MADVATLAIKVVADVKGATSGLDQVSTRSEKMRAGLSTAAKVATGVLVGLGAALLAAGQAAAQDAQGAAILATRLENATGATKGQIAAVEDWISKLTLATGVADDELRPALGTLAAATGDVSTAQDALKVALDVAAATGKDVNSVSEALAKGYAGQLTSIGRLVPGISKATLASGDMAAVMDELQQKTGGAAAAAADTTAGRMQIMTVAFNEAKESIGAGLLPVMTKFATLMAGLGTLIGEHPQAVTALAIAVGVLAAAIVAVNAVVTVWGTVTKIATAVQWLWNAAMSANPVGLVIIAVAALIAVIVLLWQKSDGFRAAVLAMWSAIRTAATTVANALRAAWTATWNAITAAASAAGGFVVGVFNTIRNAVAAVVGWIKGHWQTLVTILTGPVGLAVSLISANWQKIKTVFGNVTSAIQSLWQSTIGTLKSVVSGLGEVLSAPFKAAAGAVEAIISAVGRLISKISSIRFPSIPGPLGDLLGRSAAPPVAGARGVAGRSAAPGVPFLGSPRSSTGGGGISITVTGAIDPEATARQIRRILAGHDRRVGLAR